jgi:peroxiredoxin
MKNLVLLLSFLLLSFAAPAFASPPSIGQIAPDFTLTGADGKPHSLSGYKGKIVVLEWTNPECPYVHKHYDSGTMQKLQRDAASMYGAAWLRIDSSAPGKEGYVNQAAAQALIEKDGSAQTAFLLDPDGKVGQMYGAKATPHMFVMDADGTIVYMGAIDDAPSTNPDTLANAKSYVREALADLKKHEAIETPVTQPYGCGIKYAN